MPKKNKKLCQLFLTSNGADDPDFIEVPWQGCDEAIIEQDQGQRALKIEHHVNGPIFSQLDGAPSREDPKWVDSFAWITKPGGLGYQVGVDAIPFQGLNSWRGLAMEAKFSASKALSEVVPVATFQVY